MLEFGRFTPGFSAFIFGSFHFVILPKKMSARTGPVNFNVLVGIPGMLYASATDPIVSGIYHYIIAYIEVSGYNIFGGLEKGRHQMFNGYRRAGFLGEGYCNVPRLIIPCLIGDCWC